MTVVDEHTLDELKLSECLDLFERTRLLEPGARLEPERGWALKTGLMCWLAGVQGHIAFGSANLATSAGIVLLSGATRGTLTPITLTPPARLLVPLEFRFAYTPTPGLGEHLCPPLGPLYPKAYPSSPCIPASRTLAALPGFAVLAPHCLCLGFGSFCPCGSWDPFGPFGPAGSHG